MAHSREIRPHAYEVKFVVPAAVAAEIRRWARAELDADPHGSGPSGDEYRTTSLYLDNTTLDVFHRRGSMGRSKYRIRRYGDAGVVFLERKMRQPAVLAKRRTRIAIGALETLAPTLHTLVPSFDRSQPALDRDWSGHWFHRRIRARALRPVCQVSYFRMARGIFNGADTVRLTLDCELSARPALGYAFSDDPGRPIDGIQACLAGARSAKAGDAAILELKYRGAAPAAFKRLVEEFALVPRTASKYRMGMLAALSSSPVAPSRLAPLYQPAEFHA
jgi:hypothetical protein